MRHVSERRRVPKGEQRLVGRIPGREIAYFHDFLISSSAASVEQAPATTMTHIVASKKTSISATVSDAAKMNRGRLKGRFLSGVTGGDAYRLPGTLFWPPREQK